MTAGVPCSRKERRKARSRRGKRGIPAVITFITIIALAVILFSGYFIFQYIENSRQQSLHPGTEPHLYFMGQESSAAPFYMGEDLYLPFDFVKEKYFDNNNHNVEVFHSYEDEQVFIYFDLQKEPTDQNDMFFLGIRCTKHQEEIIHEKLLKMYKKLQTCSPFTFDISLFTCSAQLSQVIPFILNTAC